MGVCVYVCRDDRDHKRLKLDHKSIFDRPRFDEDKEEGNRFRFICFFL